MMKSKMLLMLAALALALAACGGGDDTSELPTNDDAGSGTDIDAACLVDEPECDDTPTGDQTPQDLPSSGDGDTMEPITVGDATATNGEAMVTGFLVAAGGEARLCEALAESFPPQCGGPSILLENLDQIDPDELQTEGDVTWTDFPVTVFGEIVDGTLMATPIE